MYPHIRILLTLVLFIFEHEYGMSPKLCDEIHLTREPRPNTMHSGIINQHSPITKR